MPQTKERHTEYMRKYREKKRQSQPQKPVKQEPMEKSESKPVETDCAKFRRLRTSPKKNPDDVFFCDDHLKNCLSCQNWYVQHKHENEWDFKGVNLWGEPETNTEENEQKRLEEQLAKEGFDYKRSSNSNENTLSD